MFVVIVLCFCVLTTAYVLITKKYAYWKKRNVPFPKPTLFFGNTGGAVTLNSRLSQIFSNIYNDYKGYAYVGFFNLWNPAVLVRDPELIKDVLIKQFNNFHDNWIETEQEVDPSVANNPFVLQGNQWKLIRTQLTPQFTSSKIKSMFPLIEKVCNNMVDYIKNEAKSKGTNKHEVKELCARFTGDNVISCAYGLDGKSFMVNVPDSFKIAEQISSSSKIVQLKQTLGLFFPLLRKIFKTTFLGDPVPRIFRDIILEAIKYREENNVIRNDYLDFLKQLKTKPSAIEITDNLLVAHAFTFFLDGFETSSLALTYALFELSLNPDVQNLARREIEDVLKKNNKTISYEALQEMEYVDNIISETLRKYPIIQFISRVCTEDYKFPPPKGSDGEKSIIIEKGTQIFIPVIAVHNDPDNYPDPDRFYPARFNDKSDNSRCCFLGFGDGPRICLGRKFALAQLKLGLVTILFNFEVKFNHSTSLPIVLENNHVFNSPKDSIWLDFYPKS